MAFTAFREAGRNCLRVYADLNGDGFVTGVDENVYFHWPTTPATGSPLRETRGTAAGQPDAGQPWVTARDGRRRARPRHRGEPAVSPSTDMFRYFTGINDPLGAPNTQLTPPALSTTTCASLSDAQRARVARVVITVTGQATIGGDGPEEDRDVRCACAQRALRRNPQCVGSMARFTAQTRNDRGVALFAAIAGMVLLSTMIAALVILARNENLIAQLNKDEAQAAYAAEAGANWGRRLLLQRLNVDLPAAVSAAGRPAMRDRPGRRPTTATTAGRSSSGTTRFPRAGPRSRRAPAGCAEPNYSAVGNIPDAQQTVMTITCPGTTGCPANLAFTTRVIVGTHPTIPPAITNGGLGAVFTYVWRIESSGTAGRARQQWVIHDSSVPMNTVGSFRIALNAEFVKYAHFIDQFQDAGSGDPWMSYRHVYTGPVHTNTRFSILGDTSVAGPRGADLPERGHPDP